MSEFLTVYFPFYFIALILTVPSVVNKDLFEDTNPAYDTILAFFLALGCIILFGFRSYEMGTDTKNYISAFNQIQFAENYNQALITRTAFSAKDPFFNVFTYYIGNWFGLRGYFVVLAIFYVVPIYLSVFYLTKTDRALMFLCFMSLIAFPNMGANIVRSAVSVSCCIFSLTLFYNRKLIAGTIFFFLSVAFHFSTILMFFAGLVALLPIPFFLYLLGLFILTILSAMGLGLINLPVIGDFILAYDRLSGYISGERVTGSLSPFILIFYFGVLLYACFYKYRIKEVAFDRFINMFIILTAFYFVTFGLNDSYRFGFFPSMLAPILICYPTSNYRFKNNYSYILMGFMVFFLGILTYYRTS